MIVEPSRGNSQWAEIVELFGVFKSLASVSRTFSLSCTCHCSDTQRNTFELPKFKADKIDSDR